MLRVRYPETDRMGVVYHAHYLVWFEMGRTELMRELGCTYGSLEDEAGIHFPLVEVGARYHASARYDEVIEVQTALTAVGGASVRFEYRVVRPDEGHLLVTGFTAHAAVGRDHRPCRLPAELRHRLTAGAATP